MTTSQQIATSPLTPRGPAPPAPTPPPSRISILKPPTPLTIRGRSVFLAGSIDMGSAPDWQAELTDYLRTTSRIPPVATLTVLNPRRGGAGAWSMEQTLDNRAFVEQVEWELDALDRADVIALYFAPASRAPISLLELGLYARSGRLVVCCPEGFWRRGNVQIVCRRHNVLCLDTMEQLQEEVVKRLSVLVSGGEEGSRALTNGSDGPVANGAADEGTPVAGINGQ